MGIYRPRGILKIESESSSVLEHTMYKAYLRYNKFYMENVRPLWDDRFIPKFWGYSDSPFRPGILLFEYTDGGLSKSWVSHGSYEHMMVLPDTELPRWVVKDDMDKDGKEAVVGRLEGRVEGYPRRQDLVDSYLKLNRRSERLGFIYHKLKDLLCSRVQILFFKKGLHHNPITLYLSIRINGHNYLYLCNDRKFIPPWDVKELSIEEENKNDSTL